MLGEISAIILWIQIYPARHEIDTPNSRTHVWLLDMNTKHYKHKSSLISKFLGIGNVFGVKATQKVN